MICADGSVATGPAVTFPLEGTFVEIAPTIADAGRTVAEAGAVDDGIEFDNDFVGGAATVGAAATFTSLGAELEVDVVAFFFL